MSINMWIWYFPFQKFENVDVEQKDETNKRKQLKIIYY